jgi:hypothetical protein
VDRTYRIIINGTARTGKDTFVDYCRELCQGIIPVYSFSSVTKIKEIAYILGWDGIKDERGRKFLSDLKIISSQYDGPFNFMQGELSKLELPYIVFFMIREPNEIKKFCDRIEGVRTLLLERSDVIQFENHADLNVKNYPYDYIIKNDGKLEDLRGKAYSFLNLLLKEVLTAYEDLTKSKEIG